MSCVNVLDQRAMDIEATETYVRDLFVSFPGCIPNDQVAISVVRCIGSARSHGIVVVAVYNGDICALERIAACEVAETSSGTYIRASSPRRRAM